MARPSLFAATMSLASLCSGCLITSTPTYDAPQRTPPILLAAAATPPLNKILTIDQSQPIPSLSFSTSVESEDDGQDVQIEYLLDYGDGPATGGKPFQGNEREGSVAAASLSDGPRAVTRTLDQFYVSALVDNTGVDHAQRCHTVTMMATHDLDSFTGCPVCLSDSSQLTWFIYACDTSASPPVPCDSIEAANCAPLTGSWTSSCLTYQDSSSCAAISPSTGSP